ncbi:MAG TPA: TlpA disulfide reductase family protein [Marmoricola sp.]|nr:TlpA disulfide reductase family protein [Marmoricola sp.]
MRLLGLALAVALLLTGCSSSPATHSDRLPDVSLANLKGGPDLRLRSVRGPTVVNLWASWCVPCKRELPIYAEFARKHTGKVSVLGIDFQEPNQDAADRLLKESKVSYPVVADPDGDLHAIGLPEIVLIDATGEIAYREYVEIKSLSQLEGIVEKHLGTRL